jgi:hypothetical protein
MYFVCLMFDLHECTQSIPKHLFRSFQTWPIVAHCCPLLPILYLQRDSIAAYDADPDNLVACFRASLFQHTLTTPIQANKAAEGYMKVLEGHAGHNASLHFCIGVLLLSGHRFTGQATWSDEEFVQYMSQRMQGLTQTKQQLLDKEDDAQWEKTMARAHVHIRKGYTMDPGRWWWW